MGLNLKGLLGGSSYTSPEWMRNAGQTSYEQYLAAMNDQYSPEAYRRNVANYTGDLDNQLRGQGAEWGSAMGAKGFAGSPSMAMLRAGSIAGFRSGERSRMAQGRMGALQGAGGMLAGMQGLYQKQQNPGLLGRLAPLAGAYGQYAAMGQQSPVMYQQQQDPYAWPQPLKRPQVDYGQYLGYGY